MIRRILKNQVASNASWLIGGKIIQSFLGLVVTMITARYLGPSNFGLINYASSVVTFFTPLMQLGFNSVLVQEITYNPYEEGKILGTTITLNILSAIACLIGVVSFTFIANPGETITTVVCLLYSLILLSQAIEMIQYWFQAKLMSKYTSMVSLVAYVLVSGYKIFLLVTKQEVQWFVFSYCLDHGIIGVSLIIIYHRLGGQRFQFSWSVFKRIINKSKFYIISSMMIVVLAQTDKIMLKLMLDNSATGLYSAAVTCAGLLSFVYSAIIDSFRPFIFKNKKELKVEQYELSLIRLYSIVIFCALIQSIFMTIFSKYIVLVMYGADYELSIGALRIIVWYTCFAYYGGAKDIWILAEGKQKYLVIIHLAGALANILLNAILIPILGINGAAFASLITQFFTNFILLSIIKALRHNQSLFIKALNIRIIMDIKKSF